MSLSADIKAIEEISSRLYQEANKEFIQLIEQQKNIAPRTTPGANNLEFWLAPPELTKIIYENVNSDIVPDRALHPARCLKIVMLDYLDNQKEQDISQLLGKTDRQLLKAIQESSYGYQNMKNSNQRATIAAVPSYNNNQVNISGFTENSRMSFLTILDNINISAEIKNLLKSFPKDFTKNYVDIDLIREKNLRMYLSHELTHVYTGEIQNNYERYIEEAFANYIHHFVGKYDIQSEQDLQNVGCEDYLFHIPASKLRGYNTQNFGSRNIAEEISWMAVIIAETADYKCRKSSSFNMIDWSRKELKNARDKDLLTSEEEFLKEFIPNSLFNEMSDISHFYDETLYGILDELEMLYSRSKTIDKELEENIKSDFQKNFNTTKEFLERMKSEHKTVTWLEEQTSNEENVVEKDAKQLERILQDLEKLKNHLKDDSSSSFHRMRDDSQVLEMIEDIEEKIQTEEELAKEIREEHDINSELLP